MNRKYPVALAGSLCTGIFLVLLYAHTKLWASAQQHSATSSWAYLALTVPVALLLVWSVAVTFKRDDFLTRCIKPFVDQYRLAKEVAQPSTRVVYQQVQAPKKGRKKGKGAVQTAYKEIRVPSVKAKEKPFAFDDTIRPTANAFTFLATLLGGIILSGAPSMVAHAGIFQLVAPALLVMSMLNLYQLVTGLK